MYLRSLSLHQPENNTSFNQSKEVNIINNNILSMNRVFGREISNIESSNLLKDKKLTNKPTFQFLPSKNSMHTSSQPALLVGGSMKVDPIHIEIPKTTRDPLLSNKDLSFNHEPFQDKKLHHNHTKSMAIENANPTTTPTLKAFPNYAEMEDADIQEINNPQYVPQYAKEIFNYLRTVEDKYLPKPGYLKCQSDINEKMRAILVDWLVDVHIKFKLLPETLFLTVNLIDRFLERVQITRQKLQLVGVAAMLISAKYEEIYPPEVKDFVYVTDKAYTKEEILEMEGRILSTLQFQLTITSSLRFLERYSKLVHLDQKSFHFCRYLLELALVEYKILKYLPSQLACAAIYLYNRLNKREGWSDVLAKNSKHEESNIKSCAKDLLAILQGTEQSQLQAVKRKFASIKLFEASKISVEYSSLHNTSL